MEVSCREPTKEEEEGDERVEIKEREMGWSRRRSSLGKKVGQIASQGLLLMLKV